MIAAADSLDRRYVDAFNKDNADSLMAVYWNDPRLVSIGLDGSAPQGWDSTSAEWHASMDGNPSATLEFVESHNEAVGKLVLGWGRWRLTTPSDSGPPHVIEGPYTDVKTFAGGRWVKVMDHASVAQP
jgi:ketosteroid isomerase-like protein